jgi:hypothetical protein
MGVEGTTRVVRLIILTIIKFENILLDDKFKRAREYVSTERTLEGLHNPKELRKFQE